MYGTENALEAIFIERLNRFTVKCLLGDKEVMAYLPNPGRLHEILLPGSILLIREKQGGIPFEVRGAWRGGFLIPLDTHSTNDIVESLINQGRIPFLKGWRLSKREVTFGSSRFDFLLERKEKRILMEVKTCTLYGDQLGMFPDAPTTRGSRHLLELARAVSPETSSMVLFVLFLPKARYFLPDYHTDLPFSLNLLKVKHRINIRAITLSIDNNNISVRELYIPWGLLKKEARDQGDYLLILALKKDERIRVGSMKEKRFPAGFYIYVGSARKNLQKRINRHMRLRKNFHWHIDYLRGSAQFVTAFPIRSSQSLECSIADSLRALGVECLQGFGSSDCGCQGHLFYMRENPLSSREFIDILMYYRIKRLERILEKK